MAERNHDDVDVLEFTPTQRPDTAPRDQQQPVTARLCGHEFTFHPPKRAVLFFASTMLSDEVSEADRAAAMLQLLNGTLEPGDQKRLMDVCIDRSNPIGRDVIFQLVGSLLERWGDENTDTSTLEIAGPDDGPVFYGDKPIQVRNDELDLDFTAHPVKDVVLMLVSSGISTTGSVGQQAWCVGTFLDACTDAGDSFTLNTRLRSRHDSLELEDLVEIVVQLIERWAPEQAPTNRAQRRARSTS